MGNSLNKKEKIILSLERIMAQVDDLGQKRVIDIDYETKDIYKKLTQLAYNIDKYLIEKK